MPRISTGTRRAGRFDVACPLSSTSARTLPLSGADDEDVAGLERAACGSRIGRDRDPDPYRARLPPPRPRRDDRDWRSAPKAQPVAGSSRSRSSRPGLREWRKPPRPALSPPIAFDLDVILQQGFTDASGRCRSRLIHLVDRHDHRLARGLGVVDRLDRLRADAVIAGDDDHDDIGHVGTARRASPRRLRGPAYRGR